jgi:citrate lyase subunit beta/citryl-CoA lyase
MRSKLFVPAARPELFAKALASQADSLSFDLEDAVIESRKDEARDSMRELLISDTARVSGKTLIVRVNAIDSEHFSKDIRAVVQPGLQMINLPKPWSADAVREAAHAIEDAERENGFRVGVDEPVRLLVNIESARALRIAHELACAHPRVAGLQLGLADLFEPLSIVRSNPVAVHHAQLAVRLAAAEADVFAYDTAWGNIKDQEGFRAEAEVSRRLGFIGKSCIHPSQIAIANEVFRPSDEEIAHSVRVLNATREALERGAGAYVVDGKMIDPPFVIRAQNIVATARRLGLLPPTSV